MTVTSRDFPIGYEKFDELRNEKKIYILNSMAAYD